MKRLNTFVLITMMGALTACGGGQGSKSSSSSPEFEVQKSPIEQEKEIENEDFRMTKFRKVQLNDDLSNMKEFKDNINNWIVRVEAKSFTKTDDEFECKKFQVNHTDHFTSKASFNENGIAEVNLTVEGDDPLKVDFECSHTGSEAVSISLRKSLIISEKTNMIAASLSDTSAIETLILEKEAVLVTEGKTVTLTFNELISEGGKIVTFEENKDFKSPDDQEGKSGGIINFLSYKAQGELFVELRGLPGGAQTKTKPAMTHIPPAGRELNGKNSGNRALCNGKQGHTGYQGEKGFKGLKGGDSGMIFFRATNESNLRLKVSYHPGAGQPGGAGGKGGPGSNGGKGGEFIKKGLKHGSCDRGAPGAQGADGLSGDRGPGGNNQTSSAVFQFENIFKEFDSNWEN